MPRSLVSLAVPIAIAMGNDWTLLTFEQWVDERWPVVEQHLIRFAYLVSQGKAQKAVLVYGGDGWSRLA